MNDELERLKTNLAEQVPSGLSVQIQFHAEDSNECIGRIYDVLLLFLTHEGQRWRDDDQWRQLLPEWLLDSFYQYTDQELAEIRERGRTDKSVFANIGWMFDSWLYMMRRTERDWQWWSYQIQDAEVFIRVAVSGYPTSVAALLHLIDAAGGKEINVYPS